MKRLAAHASITMAPIRAVYALDTRPRGEADIPEGWRQVVPLAPQTVSAPLSRPSNVEQFDCLPDYILCSK